MAAQGKNSPYGNIIVGLFCLLMGIFPLLSAFDIGPLGVGDINGPPWLGFASGGIFVAAGLLVMLGESAPLLKSTLGFLVFISLAAIGNWIAFGVGERVCSGSISLPWFFNEGQYSDLGCRIPFGLGAVIMDAFLVYVLVRFLQRSLGGPPNLARTLKLAEWLILITLAPFLVPLVIWLAGLSGFQAVKTRLTTGNWPRNESFIQRIKTKNHSAAE